ncbi:uncharacterized protein PpBr36_10498 [Pyricularia pennisetigena]|uniref:uncharacterized protein n=1 Tax=Pyricularia pennisetigena TaxID=1578925 RepID=UPI00114E3752|nr:uncharacterized protein PpBr36_10498 [Pyricularia pennisetigena]TLS21212.1 hypothetical protein PpBr36_10498 [Pyricularia pennisetigena]
MAATTSPSNPEKGDYLSEKADYISGKADSISEKANSTSDKGGDNLETDRDTPTIWNQVKAADRFWAHKSAVRTLQSLVALIGFVCVAWILVNTGRKYTSYYVYSLLPHFDDFRVGTVAVPIFVLSLTWGLFDLGFRFWRKQGRPTHPAIVAIADLLFWITMIVAIVYAVVGVARMQAFGYEADGEVLSDPFYHVSRAGVSSWGQYHRNVNTDTWSYAVKKVYVNQDRLEYNSTTGSWFTRPYEGPMFLDAEYNVTLGSWVLQNGTVLAEVRACKDEGAVLTCEEQERLVNDLWRNKPTHVAVGKVIAVMASLALILHFALFVRAFVEALRRRREDKIEKLRADAKFELEGKDYEERPDWMLHEEGHR